jgi:hypothetical protein
MKILILTLGAAGLLGAQTFPAVHKKDLWRDVAGEVRITDSAIEFQAAKEKHSRRWKYVDIQHFDRLNEREFVVMSYEDERKYLGRDRRFHLSLTEGAISDELFESIAKRIGKPVTDRVIGDASAGGYVIPVKHLHGFGGCEGELWILDDRIIYSTENKPDAREWQIDRDVDSVWSPNPYQVELHVFEDDRREFSHTRVFKFDLKERLSADVYNTLKLRLFALR